MGTGSNPVIVRKNNVRQSARAASVLLPRSTRVSISEFESDDNCSNQFAVSYGAITLIGKRTDCESVEKSSNLL